MLIDTHAHLHGKEFAADLSEVIARARDAGVQCVALVGVDIEDSRRALNTARESDDFFRVVAGVHPHHAASWDVTARGALFDELLKDPLVVAVGEIGLDYHYDFSPRDKQREAFIDQLVIARDAELPTVIHCREAYDDLLEVLEEFYGTDTNSSDAGLPAGVLHCYFGTLEQARRAQAIGYFIGVGGSSTFKKTEELHEVIRQMPLEQIVLETDAPYMAPIPFRGKRNESAYVSLVAARVAELKGMTVDEVLRVTGDNAMRLFRMSR